MMFKAHKEPLHAPRLHRCCHGIIRVAHTVIWG